MKKKILIPLIAVFLLLSALVITAGLYYADGLPENITYTISRFLNKIDTGFSQDQRNSAADSISVAQIDAEMPENVHAVTLDLSTELSADPSSGSYGDLVSEIIYDFNYYKNFLADTIFIVPDLAGKYENFTDAYGNKVDVLRECMNYSDSAGYTKVLVINDGMLYHDGALSFDRIQYYLSNYPFNAVVLSSETIFDAGTVKNCVTYVSDNIKNIFGNAVCVGIEIPAKTAVMGATEQITGVLQSGCLEFAVVEGGSMTDPAMPFGSVLSYWNALAATYTDITFYCKHRNDLVCTNQSQWNNYVEICDQVRFLWDCENIHGSVFYNTTALKKNKNSSSLRLSYLFYDGEYSELAVESIQIDDRSNTVVFTGKAAAGHKTLCNGVVISNAPTFTFRASLGAGGNTFRFFSCGKSLTYRIYGNTRIIYSFTPTADLSVLSNETVTVSAVCLSDAYVQCAVNGNTYQMAKTASADKKEIPAGYSVFSCGIKFNVNGNADVDLGRISITAAAGDSSETVSAASVTVMKNDNTGIFNNIIGYYSDLHDVSEEHMNRYAYSDRVTPYHDNGLGTALLCRIINDETETIGAIGEKDTYHADNSTLTAGMIDYVTGMEISDAGFLRYKLGSGLTVYGVNCELIANGYRMPNNRIVADHVDDSSAASTDLVFNIDWFSPVTVKCKPLKYWNGYSQYSYNISSFDAEYIEIKFYHATEFYNSAVLQYGENSVFSHSELYSAGDDNLILRVYLKKPGQFYGFRIYRNEANQLVVSCKKRLSGALQGKVIMLDAGHGGLSMTGTAVADNSVSEKIVTLAIAAKAKEMLESNGATVIMTRTMDTPVTLEERCVLLRKYNPDIFVSIHCDGTENETDAGTHSFYFRPYSMPLADAINRELSTVYKTHIYAPADTNYPKVDKAIKFYPFYVTRMNECPAVLVETGFMTNPVEGMILGNDNTQYWLAFGITRGIESYFGANYQ